MSTVCYMPSSSYQSAWEWQNDAESQEGKRSSVWWCYEVSASSLKSARTQSQHLHCFNSKAMRGGRRWKNVIRKVPNFPRLPIMSVYLPIVASRRWFLRGWFDESGWAVQGFNLWGREIIDVLTGALLAISHRWGVFSRNHKRSHFECQQRSVCSFLSEPNSNKEFFIESTVKVYCVEFDCFELIENHSTLLDENFFI